MSNFFYSLISFIVAIFFILLGIISVILPWSPGVRTMLVQFILEDSLLIFLSGFGLIVIGIALIIHAIFSFKRHYYVIRSDGKLLSIDESLFQDYLNSYWKQLFPNLEVPNRVEIKKNKIYIYADLPDTPLPQQKTLLERIENDLSEIFIRIFGYRNEFIISVSFQPQKKEIEPPLN